MQTAVIDGNGSWQRSQARRATRSTAWD